MTTKRFGYMNLGQLGGACDQTTKKLTDIQELSQHCIVYNGLVLSKVSRLNMVRSIVIEISLQFIKFKYNLRGRIIPRCFY